MPVELHVAMEASCNQSGKYKERERNNVKCIPHCPSYEFKLSTIDYHANLERR